MTKRIIVSIAIALMTMIIMAGCGAKEIPQKVNLVIVGGPRSNINRIPEDSESISELLYEASYTYGKVTFINADGKPHVYASVDIPEPTVHGMDEAALRKRANDYSEQLKELLKQGMAQYPESDLLTALQLASQAFAGADDDSKCILVILDSGLSTVKLDFRQNLSSNPDFGEQYMLTASPESIVEELSKESELPELNNAQVYFSYCGVTAFPQEPLTEKQKGQLRDIWESVLMAGGASNVIFTNDFATDVPYEGLPEVSVVPVDVMTIKPEVETIDTIVLDESKVQFIGDTADYVDEEAANTVLKEMAEMLLLCPDNVVYLAGTTATGRPEYTKLLSEKRAEAVKASLCEFGVPADQMIAIGLGCDNAWHIEDTDSSGSLIEKYAADNRTVRIIDISSDDAQVIDTYLAN